jgi:hypothetical protein
MLIFLAVSDIASAQFQMPRPVVGPVNSGEIMRESSTVPITSGMLGTLIPNIPNLKFGFQYFFGTGYNIGQFNLDYLLPVSIGRDEVLFGEVHGNYWDYFRKDTDGSVYGGDISLGGGYRRIVSERVLAGTNLFYDSAKGYNKWYQSGSVGFEMAANIGISSAIDFNANYYYGTLFSSTEPANLFRKNGSNYDIMAGYSMALLNEALDLRLKAAMYNFDVGNNVYAYMTGADLTTRNGLFTFTYEHGSNKINGSWDNFAVFLNLGFLIGNYFMGDNPFTLPEPVFRNGQRNLNRMLSSSVNRMANQAPPPSPTPSPEPPGACNVFVNGNRQLQTATGEVFYLQFDSPLDFSRCDSSTIATITVANPPVNPVLISLYNRSTGVSSCPLWITTGTQAISKTDFPDWFSGGPWTDLKINNVVNFPNTQGNYWIPVSFTINYGQTLTPQ